jgi:hypothetical protein
MRSKLLDCARVLAGDPVPVFPGHALLSTSRAAVSPRFLDDDRPVSHWSHQLDRYLEGWAEANPRKIIEATGRDYRFDDPLVGRFSRWSLAAYFEQLQARFARSGAVAAADLSLFIRGPMDGSLQCGRLKFVREAPRLGLTGITFITIREQGVISEQVSYDLNLASDLLRDGRSPPWRRLRLD